MTSPIQNAPNALIGHAAAPSHEKAKVQHAAKQFEAALLRTMLSSVEKAMAGKGSGASQYASMQVGALADAMSDAGGIGLARTIVDQLGRELDAPNSSQASSAPAVPHSQEALGLTTMDGSRSKK
jgi:Rod binding domain-containing protein